MSKVNSNYYSLSFSFVPQPDAEHRRIIRKLMAYGYTPTFKKSSDIELLRKIELKQAKMENCVSGKYLTVSKNEQEKIQEKKKEKRIECNIEQAQNTMKGQKILGEQLMLAIQMKKNKEKAILEKEKEKKRTKKI